MKLRLERSRTFRAAGAAALLAAASLSFVPAATGALASSQEEHADGEKSPLLQGMYALKRNLKQLGGSLKDPAKDAESLERVAAMQALALEAKKLPPTNLDSVPAEGRPAHEMAYRKDMSRLLRELCDLEIDILEGRREAAMERMQGPLANLREESHERYQE